RVAGDSEQPGAPRSALRVEAPAAPVGALEGQGGDVLGRRAVAQQPGHVGVDVVAISPVEFVEGDIRVSRDLDRHGGYGFVHAPITRRNGLHHTQYRPRGAGVQPGPRSIPPGTPAWRAF